MRPLQILPKSRKNILSDLRKREREMKSQQSWPRSRENKPPKPPNSPELPSSCRHIGEANLLLLMQLRLSREERKRRRRSEIKNNYYSYKF